MFRNFLKNMHRLALVASVRIGSQSSKVTYWGDEQWLEVLSQAYRLLLQEKVKRARGNRMELHAAYTQPMKLKMVSLLAAINGMESMSSSDVLFQARLYFDLEDYGRSAHAEELDKAMKANLHSMASLQEKPAVGMHRGPSKSSSGGRSPVRRDSSASSVIAKPSGEAEAGSEGKSPSLRRSSGSSVFGSRRLSGAVSSFTQARRPSTRAAPADETELEPTSPPVPGPPCAAGNSQGVACCSEAAEHAEATTARLGRQLGGMQQATAARLARRVGQTVSVPEGYTSEEAARRGAETEAAAAATPGGGALEPQEAKSLRV